MSERLRCTNLSKSFPGVRALNDVSLSVESGSIHALVGENGAGKSTLVNILSGSFPPNAGEVTIDGQSLTLGDVRLSMQAGIAVVHQELHLVQDLSVAENIFLGRWPSRSGRIDFHALRSQVQQVLGRLGVELAMDARTGDLPIAKQQLVEIAKALSLDAKLLILDEPSAVLTARELDALFALMRSLASSGVSMIYISHRLEEIFSIADTVTVLRDGAHISTTPIQSASRPQLIADMVGRPMEDEFPERSSTIGAPLLSVNGLSVPGRFRDMSFEIGAGEILALTGLIGSGRTSVAKTLFGAVRARHGDVRLGDVHGPFNNPRQAMAAGMAMLPEDRKQEGLLLERTIRENTSLANLKQVSRGGVLSRSRESSLASERIQELVIKCGGPEAPARTLSGGNQQKVLLGRWMSGRYSFFILDEPTRGVDVGAKFEIYTLINRLAASGKAILMITSELPEAIGMADRIGVMHEGRLMGILVNSHRHATQESIMELASGQEQKS
ncbi:MAG: sugar ABC transporter ATP-binding protein [Phycisphaerae bacterium]